MFVCLSAFYRPHDICPLCGAASESESRSRRGRPRARGQACTARACARMPYNFSTKKSYADAFQNQNCTRAYVYVTAEIFKKREKENQSAIAFSWSVYFSNRTESYLIFGRSRPWSALLLECLCSAQFINLRNL